MCIIIGAAIAAVWCGLIYVICKFLSVNNLDDD